MIQEIHIPTIGGGLNVINLELPTHLQYRALLTQSGAADPTKVVERNDYDPVVNIGYSRNAQGVYDLVAGSPIFTAGKTTVTTNDQFDVGGFSQSRSLITSALSSTSSVQIISSRVTPSLEAQDNVLNNTLIVIETLIETDDETQFSQILSKLEASQQKYWRAIVLRTINGTRQVDGSLYRKTLDLNTSSKEIQV